MQAVDISTEEFSIEALEARFEMEAVVPPPVEASWISVCTLVEV
jgi:hypothetical protein